MDIYSVPSMGYVFILADDLMPKCQTHDQVSLSLKICLHWQTLPEWAVVCWRWLIWAYNGRSCLSFQLSDQEHQVGSLQVAMVGIFTPWQSASAIDRDFFFPRELVVKHLPAHSGQQVEW